MTRERQPKQDSQSKYDPFSGLENYEDRLIITEGNLNTLCVDVVQIMFVPLPDFGCIMVFRVYIGWLRLEECLCLLWRASGGRLVSVAVTVITLSVPSIRNMAMKCLHI